MAASNLKLESFSDREILHLLNDWQGEDGWADVRFMAPSLGLSRNGMGDAEYEQHCRRCLGIRLAWIKRLTGTVESNPDRRYWWRLTEVGEQVVNAKIGGAVAKGIEQMADLNTLLVLKALCGRFQNADGNAANLMRREWQHGTYRKRT